MSHPPIHSDARVAILESLIPDTYEAHSLHSLSCDWPEKNCYEDVLIETLHALGLEPLAMLGHTITADFLDDQWTFMKPQHAELRELYGVDVQEMTIWRPLEDHLLEHVAAGRFVSMEADAFWLPDTSGTDYRTRHTKTTIIVNSIDARARRLGYFHNAGYFELEGEDYLGLLRINAPPDPEFLPLFAELVCVNRRFQAEPERMAAQAVAILYRHHAWRPPTNPFERFGQRMARDMPVLRDAGIAHYHLWAFASIRQAGAAFELASAHLRWLCSLGHPALEDPARHFAEISSECKSLILKAARAAAGKSFDPLVPASAMARAWDEGMTALGRALG